MSDTRRYASITRDTNETKIQLSLSLDGGQLDDDSSKQNGDSKASHAAQSTKAQVIDVNSGIGFLDHMLHALAKHAGWSLRLRCQGDLHSTYHHAESQCTPETNTRRQSTITTQPKTPASPSARPSKPPSQRTTPASPASAPATRPSTKHSPAPSSISPTGPTQS